MASILFAYALLGLDGRVWAQGCDPPGALCITQTPTGSTAWSATEVEPYGDPYVYDVTAHWVGFNTVGFTSVNIDRESGYEGASITIRKLTVIRPDEDDEWLSVSLGNSSVR